MNKNPKNNNLSVKEKYNIFADLETKAVSLNDAIFSYEA